MCHCNCEFIAVHIPSCSVVMAEVFVLIGHTMQEVHVEKTILTYLEVFRME